MRFWHDQPVSFFLVQPSPVALEHDISAHILIVQDETAHQVSSLVTVFRCRGFIMDTHFGSPLSRMNMSLKLKSLSALVYTEDCTRFGEQVQCTLRHASFKVPNSSAAIGRDGDHVTLLVQRSHQFDHTWHPPFLPVAPGLEGLLFLQQKATLRQHQSAPDTIKPNASIQLLVDDVQHALRWFDTYFVLPCF